MTAISPVPPRVTLNRPSRSLIPLPTLDRDHELAHAFEPYGLPAALRDELREHGRRWLRRAALCLALPSALYLAGLALAPFHTLALITSTFLSLAIIGGFLVVVSTRCRHVRDTRSMLVYETLPAPLESQDLLREVALHARFLTRLRMVARDNASRLVSVLLAECFFICMSLLFEEAGKTRLISHLFVVLTLLPPALLPGLLLLLCIQAVAPPPETSRRIHAALMMRHLRRTHHSLEGALSATHARLDEEEGSLSLLDDTHGLALVEQGSPE